MARKKPPQPGDEVMLTPVDVAAKLNISPTAVYSLIRKGDLPAVNLALSGTDGSRGFYRISPDALKEFLDRRQVTEPPIVEKRQYLRRHGLKPLENHLGL